MSNRTVPDRTTPVFVAGRKTLVGGAIVRGLEQKGIATPSEPCDLADRAAVDAWFGEHRPSTVFLAAGRSGGIGANRAQPADLMLDNLRIDTTVIDAARRHEVRRLLYVAPPCVYPRDCPQPMQVEHLLCGPLEPTNAAYGMAKLAGIELCRAVREQYDVDFRVAVTANPYGPEEDFSPNESHVIPALLRKMHEAQVRGDDSIEIWGTGKPVREFAFVDDVAEACLAAMRSDDSDAIMNLGGGVVVSIAELAETIRTVIGYDGDLRFDESRPDGMPRKTLRESESANRDRTRRTDLVSGLRATYAWYLNHIAATDRSDANTAESGGATMEFEVEERE